MKMISSTSTTSTSGVILISDCRLDSELSLLSCMMSVSSCLSVWALGNQSHTAKAGLLDRHHGLPDRTEIEFCVGSNHNPGVRFVTHRGAEGLTEVLG